MNKTDAILLQHRAKENGDKVFMAAYWDGRIEMTVADKLTEISSAERKINYKNILSLN